MVAKRRMPVIDGSGSRRVSGETRIPPNLGKELFNYKVRLSGLVAHLYMSWEGKEVEATAS